MKVCWRYTLILRLIANEVVTQSFKKIAKSLVLASTSMIVHDCIAATVMAIRLLSYLQKQISHPCA